MTQTDIDRFWAKVDKDGPLWEGTPCWLWTAGCSTKGYGVIQIDGKQKRAHIIARVLLVGAIPAKHEVHHKCPRKNCINPTHTVPLTPKDHVNLGTSVVMTMRMKTQCRNGHAYTAGNTTIFTHRQGYRCRRCRACHREQMARMRNNTKESVNAIST